MTHKKSSGLILQNVNPWDIFIIVISLGMSVFITINMGEKSYDDAYITFRYAKNLTQELFRDDNAFFYIITGFDKDSFPCVFYPFSWSMANRGSTFVFESLHLFIRQKWRATNCRPGFRLVCFA